MSIGEAIQKGIILLVIVFIVLFILYAGIIIFGKLLNRSGGKSATEGNAAEKTPAPEAGLVSTAIAAPSTTDGSTYVGKLRLKNVDEQTAAMIMAIVSDESGIPLSELQFKSISLVADKDQ